ncbi:MAG: hypothetical protein WBZ36_11540 [Candidatus Nitrosopolaris sp.]
MQVYNGGVAHDVFTRLFMMFPERFRCQMHIQYENVIGRIDVYDRPFRTVIEIKTSNSTYMLKPNNWDVKQLRYYLSMTGCEEGVIIYQLNVPMKYVIFPIHMNEIEHKQELEKLKNEARSLYHAIETRDPSAAKAIYDDKELDWLCKNCPYVNKCIAMRNVKDEETVSTWKK